MQIRRRAFLARLGPVPLAAVACAVLLGPSALAQGPEHPEHPKKKEHPEHPEKSAKGPTFTTRDMARAIERHVKQDAELKGGKFLVWDPVKERPLVLALEKVHEEWLAQVADDTAFVCADFKAADGTLYDLDFFLTGPDGDHLTVTDLAIHKEAGKPRYAWDQVGDKWVRKPL